MRIRTALKMMMNHATMESPGRIRDREYGIADIGDVPSHALVVSATPKEIKKEACSTAEVQQASCKYHARRFECTNLCVSYELRRNPPDTPTTATMNPRAIRRITIRVSGLLIDDMRKPEVK